MSKIGIAVAGFLLASLMLLPGNADAAQEGTELEQGRYLVHQVARCIECHSPRNARGEIDRSRLLMGAPIPFESPFGTPWAFQAPALAGLPGWDSKEVVHILTTGRRLSGHQPRAPMPQYRLRSADAEAVVTYLASLR
ncbi:MAG: cytochrome C [Acidobacteriota bacterium]|nr:MAG: cytochrome C [Acidobacteriota bacterium]